MEVWRIDISGRQCLIYIPIPNPPSAEIGLELLLAAFGATLTRTDDLVPCFDMDEMKRRNMQIKKGPTRCS
jgi:hypothetical protein